MSTNGTDYCPWSYTERHSLRRAADTYVCVFCGQCEHAFSGRIIIHSRPYARRGSL